VVIVDGLPGCGKNHLCNLITDKGYRTADIDSWSQDVLKKSFRDFSQFQKCVKKEITDKIHELLTMNPHRKFVLCGVSAMIYPDNTGADVRTVDVVHGADTNDCQKIWVDISPREDDFSCPKMLETTRRAVLQMDWLQRDRSRRRRGVLGLTPSR
jgi:hypothetical protein